VEEKVRDDSMTPIDNHNELIAMTLNTTPTAVSSSPRQPNQDSIFHRAGEDEDSILNG